MRKMTANTMNNVRVEAGRFSYAYYYFFTSRKRIGMP